MARRKILADMGYDFTVMVRPILLLKVSVFSLQLEFYGRFRFWTRSKFPKKGLSFLVDFGLKSNCFVD